MKVSISGVTTCGGAARQELPLTAMVQLLRAAGAYLPSRSQSPIHICGRRVTISASKPTREALHPVQESTSTVSDGIPGRGDLRMRNAWGFCNLIQCGDRGQGRTKEHQRAFARVPAHGAWSVNPLAARQTGPNGGLEQQRDDKQPPFEDHVLNQPFKLVQIEDADRPVSGDICPKIELNTLVRTRNRFPI